MSDNHDRICKVKCIGMYRLKKHPLCRSNELTSEDREKLITNFINVSCLSDVEIEREFNDISMDTVLDDSFDYSSLPRRYPDIYEKHKDEYDDDLTRLVLKRKKIERDSNNRLQKFFKNK